MSDREMQRRSSQSDDAALDDEADTAAPATEQDTALDDDVDAILDEIDEVLEANAAEFVQGFVQKGGQ
jgi:ubiquitin-like protein Pup